MMFSCTVCFESGRRHSHPVDAQGAGIHGAVLHAACPGRSCRPHTNLPRTADPAGILPHLCSHTRAVLTNLACGTAASFAYHCRDSGSRSAQDFPVGLQTTALAADWKGLWMLMQTSSPSYLLMSSLDAARHQAVQPSTWTEPTQAAMRICDGLCNLPGITLLEAPSGICSSILSTLLASY